MTDIRDSLLQTADEAWAASSVQELAGIVSIALGYMVRALDEIDDPDRSDPPSETIVAAAVQIEGVTFSLPRPARHGQVFHALDGFIPDPILHTACQGFLTSEGRFVNRVQAKHIAHRAGQKIIRDDPHPRDAFSEDFW